MDSSVHWLSAAEARDGARLVMDSSVHWLSAAEARDGARLVMDSSVHWLSAAEARDGARLGPFLLHGSFSAAPLAPNTHVHTGACCV